MLPGAIFFHELRATARRRRSYALRFLIGCFLLYSLIVNSTWSEQRELSTNDMARLGGELFGNVAFIQMAVILLLTPAFLAGAIAEDRDRKVLPYLLTS